MTVVRSASEQLAALVADLGLGVDGGAAQITGSEPVLAARYPLASSAAAVIAGVGLVASRIWTRRGGEPQRVEIDLRHAGALMRGFYDQVIDGQLQTSDPTDRLPLAGCYQGSDGRWLQLYGVIEPLAERTLRALGAQDDRASLRTAVAGRSAAALEEVLAAAGAPAAMVRTAEQWQAHPHGRLPARAPLVSVERVRDAPPPPPPPRANAVGRPLDGIRVLDLTRVVAGPVCGRTLAEHGADVLLVNGPGLPWIARAMIDTAIGKRSAIIDLHEPAGRAQLVGLVSEADVFCQSARPASLTRYGLDVSELIAHRPGLVYVSIDGWGTDGPWAGRAGFEALAQAVTGWSSDHSIDGVPRPVPALACDHLTGYLAALGTLEALARRLEQGGGWHVHVSLSRVASWLREQGDRLDPAAAIDLSATATADLRIPLPGAFGVVSQLRPAPSMSRTPPSWSSGAVNPGSSSPRFG